MKVKAREPTWRAIRREAPLAEDERREGLFIAGVGVGFEAIMVLAL